MAKKLERDGIDEILDGDGPIDTTPPWNEFYQRIAKRIGRDSAWSWFRNCRFISFDQGELRLAHWCRFSAEESLRRHGHAIFEALPEIQKIKIDRHGGIKPAVCEGPAIPAPGSAFMIRRKIEQRQINLPVRRA